MADLHGVKHWLLLVALYALMAWLSPAWASFPATQTLGPWSNSGNFGCGSETVTGATLVAAGDALIARANACQTYHYISKGCSSVNESTDTTGTCTISGGPSSPYNSVTYTNTFTRSLQPAACPSNSTLSGTSCTCNSGYAENSTHTGCNANGSAAAYCSSAAGEFGGDRVTQITAAQYASGIGDTYSTCVTGLGPLSDGSSANCSVSGSVTMRAEGKDGKYYAWTTNTHYSGAPCNPTTDPVSQTPQDKTASCTDPATCPPPVGKCPGTVNGVAVWADCSATSSNTTKTTTGPGTNTDGSAGTRQNSTSTSTSCNGSTCTTTNTTTDCKTDGTDCKAPVSISTSSSKTVYCSGNVTDAQCGGGSWGGSCAAGFTCDGDSAQCAAAKGVWDQKCALVDGPDTPPAEKTAYQSAAASSSAGLGTTTVTISSANFDSSNALGVGASCIADLSVTVWGTPQTIQVSKVCPWLSTLGTIMLALSWLSAAVIVGKGVTG